ncbi:MAG TPA: CHAT domain-containing tetratricopeptide repeat protein [Polyangiaceae bacterium]|nr:CHAT domain-containing tetratricopeptide repeat protein [Polyangiaceae bacterium]
MAREFVARLTLRIALSALPVILLAQQGAAAPRVERVKGLDELKRDADACLRRAEKSKEMPVKVAERMRCELQRIRGMQDATRPSGNEELMTKMLEIELMLWDQVGQARERLAGLPLDTQRYLALLEELATLSGDDKIVLRAAAVFQQVLDDAAKNPPSDKAKLVEAMVGLGRISYVEGSYVEAAAHFQKAHELQTAAGNQRAAALTLSNLAGAYLASGEIGRATDTFRKALEAAERHGLTGSEPARVALIQAKLARLSALLGDQATAARMTRSALERLDPLTASARERIEARKRELDGMLPRQSASGDRVDQRHVDPVARSSARLANESERLGTGAMKPEEAEPKPDAHAPYLADLVDATTALLDLSSYYRAIADFTTAQTLLARAREVDELNVGKEHANVAVVRSALGNVYLATGELERAKAEFDAAVQVLEKAKSKDHPDVASALQNAALARFELKDMESADRLLTRAVVILENALGAKHPTLATALHNHAYVKQALGDIPGAIALERRAHTIVSTVFGERHPLVGGSLAHLAELEAQSGDLKSALASVASSSDAIEQGTRVLLGLGSEAQKLAYFRSVWRDSDQVIAFQLGHAKDSQEAAEVALTAVLRRKARVLDAVSDTLVALRARSTPADRELLDKLAAAKARFASLVVQGPTGEVADYQQSLQALSQEQDQLQTQLNESAASLLDVGEPVTSARVAARLPENAALIEYTTYRTPAADGSFGEPKLAAYVLRRDGKVHAHDLGALATLRPIVAALRQALSKPGPMEEMTRASHALWRAVVEPLAPALDGADELYLSPEGELNLVPFEALVDGAQTPMLKRYLVTYLTTGRELVERPKDSGSASGVVVFADPNFDAATTVEPAASATTSAGFLHGARFSALPGTAEEAQRIGQAFAGALVFAQARASKSALLAQHAPRILHIATHGFFLQQQGTGVLAGSRGLGLSADVEPETPSIPNPLLRSGLAFAGANQPGTARADGVLTALEASALDLHGTRLVVLSACETGLGQLESDDGVYGLRRSLHIAGAQTQVMSLWKVDDATTSDLMAGYYQGLVHGEGRSNAMREAKLALLAGSATAHPYYWASFIVSGNPDNLDGQYRGVTKPAPVPAPVRAPQRVEPGARGCGCQVPGGSAPSAAWLLLATLPLWRRRRS